MFLETKLQTTYAFCSSKVVWCLQVHTWFIQVTELPVVICGNIYFLNGEIICNINTLLSGFTKIVFNDSGQRFWIKALLQLTANIG